MVAFHRAWIVLLAMATHVNAQDIIEVQVVDEPLVANGRGELVPASLSGTKSYNPGARTAVKLEQIGSSRAQLRKIYDLQCPGLISGFKHLQDLDGFAWRISPEHQNAIFGLVSQALTRREEFLIQAESVPPENFHKNVRLLEKVFESEREADERLSELFNEIVTPEQSPYYFTAMGRFFERGLLTSQYFSKLAGVPNDEFQRRLKAAQEFSKWNVQAQLEGKPDRKAFERFVRPIYEDLTIGQFLDLKVLLGEAKPNGNLTDYLARTKNSKLSTAIYVPAIEKVLAEKQR